MNSEIIFLPTPNWFISQAIDLNSQDSVLATCALNSIIFTNAEFESHIGTIKEAHSKRLHSVSFYKINKFDFLASCSEDLEIKIWDYKKRSLVNHHKLHQNAPTCLDWIRIEEQDPIVLSCDTKGNIFKWNVNTSQHARYFPENKPITQIKILSNSFKTAVGYKTGTIVLLDSKSDQMNILAKLKSHENSINCLLWSPKSNDDNSKICEEIKCNTLEHVLASSSEDKTIRLWDTIKGIQLKNFKVPSNGSKAAKKVNQINYVPLCWPKTNLILTASFKGDLFFIDLENLKSISANESIVKWNQFTALPDPQCHKKIIFDITHCNDKIITLSLDRLLNTWCLKSLKQEKSLLTLNGFVYSIAFSPIDPNFVAIAVGDSSIKLMKNKHKVKTFSNNIRSEVTQIAWHPVKESLIAFGTKDGKVGIADIISSSKEAILIYTGFNQSIYTLVWSQDLLNSELDVDLSKKNYLYSVADGKIMLHYVQSIVFGKDSMSPDKVKSINFYNFLKNKLNEEETNSEYGLTEFSILKIKSGGNFFCIGKFDGSIECYKSQYNEVTKICILFNHQKLVTCIKWNAEEYDESLNKPIYMASGSNDFNVIIVDFDEILEQNKRSNIPVNLYSKYKFKLEGHKERITCLSWCKSLNSMLASSSYDSTVQIWNTDLGEGVANYRGHSDKILCCLFSNQDTNEVYSGGEDYCLHKWKIDSQEFKTPPEECPILFGKKKIKHAKKQIIGKKLDQEISTIEYHGNHEIELNRNETEMEKIPDLNEKHIKSVQGVLKTLTKSQKSTELKSLFTLSSPGSKNPKQKLKDCILLFEHLVEKNKISNINQEIFEFDKDNLILNIFCNRTSSLNLIQIEEEELKRINYEKWWIFEIWKGNLYKVVRELKNSKQLNDLVMSLYQSMISVINTSSLELVNYYIGQLSSNGNNIESVNKAILHCCCTYQIEKAVEICLENNLFQYALCLAQIRLPLKSEILKKVLIKYAAYSTQVGDYETSVLCYIRLEDLENAYKTLIRRNAKNDCEFEQNLNFLSDKFKTYLNIQ